MFDVTFDDVKPIRSDTRIKLFAVVVSKQLFLYLRNELTIMAKIKATHHLIGTQLLLLAIKCF